MDILTSLAIGVAAGFVANWLYGWFVHRNSR